MFNLLVKQGSWNDSRDRISHDRILEHTSELIVKQFKTNGYLSLESLTKLPSLFLEEVNGDPHQVVHVGRISRADISGSDCYLEYTYDSLIPPLTSSFLKEIASELDISKFEFQRTHWSVKDRDLFHVLLRKLPPNRRQPQVFNLSDPENIVPDQVSVMMPFDQSFNNVYTELKNTAESIGFRCNRADNIWEHPNVIQDVVSLIDRSKIVICDCSNRNPNVFYEIGIAHTLGRETILITQSEQDIPFDLRHLRFVKYLNNSEGLNQLRITLYPRLKQFFSN